MGGAHEAEPGLSWKGLQSSCGGVAGRPFPGELLHYPGFRYYLEQTLKLGSEPCPPQTTPSRGFQSSVSSCVHVQGLWCLDILPSDPMLIMSQAFTQVSVFPFWDSGIQACILCPNSRSSS